MNENMELIVAMAGLALPFLILVFDMNKKITKIATMMDICPNCPKTKGE